MTGWWVLVGVFLLTLSFGGYRALTNGRPTRTTSAAVMSDSGGELGQTATFVQFSSEFCAPCRATAKLLDEVSSARPGVLHREVDVATELDLAQEWGIMRTPTVLLLDGGGRLHSKIVGVPRRDAIVQALDGLAEEMKVG